MTRRLYRYLQRIAHYRHVAAEQLILQGLGAGGNNRLAARQQRRQQIGNGLALSRAVIPRGAKSLNSWHARDDSNVRPLPSEGSTLSN